MASNAGPRASRTHRDRYSTVAIVFHWAIAAGILAQILLGWRMEDLEGFSRVLLLQVHKTVGIAVLLLSVARLGWRLANPPPAAPEGVKPLEKRLALWAHRAFYFALLALPLTGWAMSSVGRPGALKLAGGLPWPALPVLNRLPAGAQDTLSTVMSQAHTALVWLMLALLALHVAGALKHQLVSRDATVARMAPGVRPGRRIEPRLALIPAAGVAVAVLVYAPTPKPPPPRPQPKELAKADVYLDIVSPALNRRCGACHNAERAQGGLSLASYEDLAQGALHGPVLRPGDADHSELYKRITLPTSHALYMPKDNKTPLNKAEVAAIHWWIAQGAPGSAAVSSLKLTPEARTALQTITGLGDEQRAAGGDAPLPSVAAADPAQVARTYAAGFVVRKVSKDSNLLEADYIGIGSLTHEGLAELTKLAPQLLRLNLRGAGIDDAMLATVAGFPHLRQLRLEENPITDAGAERLLSARELTYLNLVNTRVTDAGLARLAALPELRRLYVWGAPGAVAGAETMHSRRTDVTVVAGLSAKDVPVETRVMTPTN